MLLPEKKEREYRFRLALRMGLPIFGPILILISTRLITDNQNLDTIFYVEAILLLAFSIYFIFYIIYKSFDTKITEPITKTFTREYLYKYLKKEIQNNKEYTILLVSIDNLSDINSRYGIKNGDNVLREVTSWVSEYLLSKELHNFPMGHIKGGDFGIGLKGNKDQYNTILELMNLKTSEFKVNDIEVKISTSITDTSYSKELNHLIENLFELRQESKNQKETLNIQEMNPSELEFFVVSAIKEKLFTVMVQNVFEDSQSVIKECFVKLKTKDNKTLYPKSYMKVINKLGLMLNYDLMVLEKNVTVCSDKCKEVIAMSVSPTSLRSSYFLTRVRELLDDNKNVKNRIMFILSESEYYSHIDRYNSILKSLRNMGVLIAIDRLGSMHTSFLYLRDLNIDIVRFDSIYTKEIQKRDFKSMIDGFNLMAHEKNVKTWIKMIENEDTKKLATEMNIDYLQGKYLANLEKIYDS